MVGFHQLSTSTGNQPELLMEAITVISLDANHTSWNLVPIILLLPTIAIARAQSRPQSARRVVLTVVLTGRAARIMVPKVVTACAHREMAQSAQTT